MTTKKTTSAARQRSPVQNTPHQKGNFLRPTYQNFSLPRGGCPSLPHVAIGRPHTAPLCAFLRQGRAETCRYLVLLGADPRLADGDGSDAFKLAEGHPSVKTSALCLAAAVRRGAPRRDSGGGGGGGGGRDGGGASSRPAGGKLVERAPTAGSAVARGKGGLQDLEKGKGSSSGDVGEGRDENYFGQPMLGGQVHDGLRPALRWRKLFS